jgi:trigger factor
VKTTVEPLEGNKVKLSVAVDEQEFEAAINDAFRKIAREVRIPGFRPGKVPRKVLEARIGKDAARHQALNDAIPEYYADAVRDNEVDVIAAPEIDITDGEEDGPVLFDAVVEIRPRITVPGYGGLRVTIPSPRATDDEIDAQIERLRSQFGELATVERPAAGDDYVTIDVAGSQDGEPLEGLTADDYLYQVGSGLIVPELDEQLRGAKVGDILQFEAAHPSDPDEADLSFRVLVKEVKERQLPDLDDAFADEASEFETLDELRADLEKRMSTVKKMQASMALREKVGEALAELVEDDVPEALVNAEMQERLHDLGLRLQAQGMGLEQWLEMSGRSQDQLVDELKATATLSAKVDLALRAVAEAEGIEADEDDLQAEYDAAAERLGLEPKKVRAEFERARQDQAIRSDIKKRKALDWLVENVEIVDESGQPIDRAELELGADDEDESPETAATGEAEAEDL